MNGLAQEVLLDLMPFARAEAQGLFGSVAVCFLLVWVIVEPTGVGAACPGWGAFGGVEPSLASGAQKGACQLLFMTSRERENRALGPGKSP